MTALPAPVEQDTAFKVGDRVIYRETNKPATVTRVVRLPEFSDPRYVEVRFDDGWVCTYRAASFNRASVEVVDSAREVIARQCRSDRDAFSESWRDVQKVFEEDLEDADRYIAALQSAGYAVVPVEPSQAMLDAAFDASGCRAAAFPDSINADLKRMDAATYRAMLAASGSLAKARGEPA